MFDIQIAEHYWNNLLKICTYWHRLLIDLRKLNKLLSYNKDISFIDEKSLKYFWQTNTAFSNGCKHDSSNFRHKLSNLFQAFNQTEEP